jgi:hypothetical protein
MLLVPQRLGNSLRAAEFLSHAINVLKETGKAESTAVDLLLWRVMGHCWPLPQEPEFSPVDTNLQRLEHSLSPGERTEAFDAAPVNSCLVGPSLQCSSLELYDSIYSNRFAIGLRHHFRCLEKR